MSNKQNPIAIHDQMEEQRQSRRDLIWVLMLNGIFLGLIVALYFVNRATGLVDDFFAKLLKF